MYCALYVCCDAHGMYVHSLLSSLLTPVSDSQLFRLLTHKRLSSRESYYVSIYTCSWTYTRTQVVVLSACPPARLPRSLSLALTPNRKSIQQTQPVRGQTQVSVERAPSPEPDPLGQEPSGHGAQPSMQEAP